ncbi:MAG: aminoacyl-tRNA hydrolase [Deltaproteobacteria bacterium]|nr:aminoacyl-tRNA hydrolase [Deltaproteobacteria bacterium]
MWLVVGLGNPGAKYERNRHNIGFRVVEAFADKHGLPAWKTGKLGGATTGGVVLADGQREKVQLLKPMEFMNLSGFAVQRAADFHSVAPEKILVVHDEVDLPFGVIRLKNGGGHGGHNGLRSMIDQLGANTFSRVRMGVGRDLNVPAGKQADTAKWVLTDFPTAQASIISEMLTAAGQGIETVLAKGIVPAMNQHNSRPSLAPAAAPS